MLTEGALLFEGIMTTQDTCTAPYNGADVIPADRIFRRNSTIRVTFSGDGELLRVEEANPLEDWPGWE